jgi:Fuc2NAc and GlcNAc transferase
MSRCKRRCNGICAKAGRVLVSTLWVCGAAFALSWVLTGHVRRMAIARGMLDRPNERSSHSVPMPRVGGVAVVITTTVGLLLLLAAGELDLHLAVALIGGGLAIALVGYVDDRRPLSARIRLAVHLGAALWALMWLGGLPPLLIGGRITALGPAGYVLGVLGVVWVLNLFNFMDGIDGIAASEAVFVVWGAALVAGGSGAVSAAGLIVGAACCGFLLWNWPPAKIFMGDVGSGYLGYVIGVLAVASAREHPAALWTWLILGGLFFVDATVTLARRALRRERLHHAHRSHAYQRLASRWHSHGRVTTVALAIDCVWLLPCALFAGTHPGLAAWTVVVALAPLAILVFLTGAGLPDT